MSKIVGLCLCLALFGCAAEASGTARQRPVPPPMPKRAIAPPTTAPAGTQVEIDDGRGATFTLFITAGYRAPADGRVHVTVHFHGATWFAIDEHLRRGLAEPLIAFYPGEGSTKYRVPFEDRERLARWLGLVEAELMRRGLGKPALRVTSIDVSSYSAGYGAVREIVKSPEYVNLIRRIVLADSMYASWDAATTQPGATSRPAADQIQPWVPFAKLAAEGKKTFVLTHSYVPTSYANTAACAAALTEAVGAKPEDVKPTDALPATLDPDFPLVSRTDVGNFHVWGYAGTDAAAHMTHPRHIADVWKALDAAEDDRNGQEDPTRQ